MEEDIKQCEDLIRILDKTSETGKSKHTDCIRNLIARNKELELCLKAEKKYAEGLNNDIKSLLHIEPNDNFVPKSKIKEKIEELEVMGISQDIYYDDIKRLFQELLEE